MKSNIYLFRVSFLELYYPIIINEDIILLPNEESVKEEIESNYTHIDFNPQTYSYILIQNDLEKNKEELENVAKIVLSMLSILLMNPLYLQEYYHYVYEENDLYLQEALLVPFLKGFFEKKQNYLHGRLGVHTLNEISGDLFQTLSNNIISDTIYSIIMEYIAAHREIMIDISGPIAWNVLEHLASRYWNKQDKEKLYILKKDKFEGYINTLKECADLFIRDQIDKENDVMLNHQDYEGTYKTLLKNKLSPNILEFSPIKFRIFKMFEVEGIEYESKKDLIKSMYDIRNKIYHDGLSLRVINEQLRKNPVEVIVKFKAFLYRKLLEFLGFIDKYLEFVLGHLVIKNQFTGPRDLLSWEPNIPHKQEEIMLVKEINLVNNMVQEIMDKDLDITLFFGEIVDEVKAKISQEDNQYFLTIIEPPLYLDSLPSREGKYPEDLIRFSIGFRTELNYGNFRYIFQIYGSPIDQRFLYRFLNNHQAETDESSYSFMKFKCSSILIVKSNN